MKMKPVTKRVPWTPEHNRELVDLYNKFLQWQESGEPYQKAKHVRALAEKQGRTKGSIETKLMNVSAIRQNVLNLPIVTGYKALDNYNYDLAVMVCADHGYTFEKPTKGK
jgi:hypothetical protein